MRSTLHIKFIALYIIFGFLCLFSTATLTEQLVTDKLTEDTSHTLYREATLLPMIISHLTSPAILPFITSSHSCLQ